MSSGPGGARPTWQRPRGGDAGAVSGAGASVRAAGARAPARTEAHPTGRCEAAGELRRGGVRRAGRARAPTGRTDPWRAEQRGRGRGQGAVQSSSRGSRASGAGVARHQGGDGVARACASSVAGSRGATAEYGSREGGGEGRRNRRGGSPRSCREGAVGSRRLGEAVVRSGVGDGELEGGVCGDEAVQRARLRGGR